MKKTYRNLTMYTVWAVLVGLAIVTGPAIGFGQDTNELVAQVTDGFGDEPADEPGVDEFSEETAEKLADEVVSAPANEPTDTVVNEVAEQATPEPGDETAAIPVDQGTDSPMNRRGNRRMDRRDNEQVTESGTTWRAYGIITQRNMFSRNRMPPRRNDEPLQETTRRPDPNPESYYILRGIVRENDTFIAFVQDNRQGGVLELREGDAVARGKVKSLTLDSIEYEMGENTTTVALGYDLEGGRGALNLDDLSQWSMSNYSSSSAQRSRNMGRPSGGRTGSGRFNSGRITGGSTSSSSVEPLTGDDAELERWLMERRQQQLQ